MRSFLFLNFHTSIEIYILIHFNLANIGILLLDLLYIHRLEFHFLTVNGTIILDIFHFLFDFLLSFFLLDLLFLDNYGLLLFFKVLLSNFGFHLLFVTFQLLVELLVKFGQLLLLCEDDLVFVSALEMLGESGGLACERRWICAEALGF